MLLELNDLFIESCQYFRTRRSATPDLLDHHRDWNYEYRRMVESNRAAAQWTTEQRVQAQQFSREVEPADPFAAIVQ